MGAKPRQGKARGGKAPRGWPPTAKLAGAALPVLVAVAAYAWPRWGGGAEDGQGLKAKAEKNGSGAQPLPSPRPSRPQEADAAGQSVVDHAAGGEQGSWAEVGGVELPPAALGQGLDQMTLPGAEVQARVVSQSPRIYIFDDLLRPEECDYLIGLADGRLKPAGVVLQTEDKYTVQRSARNNEQIWLTNEQERELPMLRHILKRMHRVAHVPDTDAEGLQVGRYLSGQKYEAHIDTDPAHDVGRPATLLTYLSDVESGGDTLFPLQEARNCDGERQLPDGRKTYGCAVCCDADRNGTIRVRPKKGRAILFFNHEPAGAVDPLSLHAACPVHAGAKWIAQRWFRTKPYQNVRYGPDKRFDGLPQYTDSAPALASGPWNGNVRELSRKAPRIYLLEAFLAPEECEHLLALARGNETDAARQLPWDAERSDPVLARVAKRLARAAYMPESHSEPFRLVPVGGAGSSGMDRRAGAAPHPAMEENRYATVLMFLNDGEAGSGDLVLRSGRAACTMPACCGEPPGAKGLLRVPPRRGRAVLLYPDGMDAAANGFCQGPDGGAGEALWVAQRSFASRPGRGVVHARDPAHDVTPQGGMLVL